MNFLLLFLALVTLTHLANSANVQRLIRRDVTGLVHIGNEAGTESLEEANYDYEKSPGEGDHDADHGMQDGHGVHAGHGTNVHANSSDHHEGNDSHHGDHGFHGIHVASFDFDYVKQPLMVSLFMIAVVICKIGNYKLSSFICFNFRIYFHE